MRPIPALIAVGATSLLIATAVAAPPDVPGHIPSDMLMPMKAPPPAELPNRGKVLHLIKGDSYAYIEVTRDKDSLWIAGPLTPLQVGDTIGYSDGAVVNDFYSKTLQRSFPKLMFADHIVVLGGKK